MESSVWENWALATQQLPLRWLRLCALTSARQTCAGEGQVIVAAHSSSLSVLHRGRVVSTATAVPGVTPLLVVVHGIKRLVLLAAASAACGVSCRRE